MKKLLARWALVLLLPAASNANQETMKPATSIVVFETNMGHIEVTLMPEVAPKACENFIGLVQKHYYDGVLFHR